MVFSLSFWYDGCLWWFATPGRKYDSISTLVLRWIMARVLLHELGYLPLEIRALPEGTVVIWVFPIVEMRNTHPRFAWLVQWVVPAPDWSVAHVCLATVGWGISIRLLRSITIWLRPGADPLWQWLTSVSVVWAVWKTQLVALLLGCCLSIRLTIPALPYLDDYYNADCAKNKIGGAVSTEHSVMAANYAIDGDEISFVSVCWLRFIPIPASLWYLIPMTTGIWWIILSPLVRKKFWLTMVSCWFVPDSWYGFY